MTIKPKIKIMVATHKQYEFPDDPGYFALQVGKAISSADLGVLSDGFGVNISYLNASFSELTGLYWMWKNVDSEYVGLSHYRRYFKPFSKTSISVKGKPIASSVDLLFLAQEYDVIVSKQRCYFVDTIRTHYRHAHYESDLDELEKVISEMYPDYLEAFHEVMGQHCVSLYNMFVMNKSHFNDYSDWLFSILNVLEKRIPYQNYGPYQRRVFGFLGERMFNIWLKKQDSELTIYQLGVVNIEGENLFRKAAGLLKRKFLGSKLD